MISNVPSSPNKKNKTKAGGYINILKQALEITKQAEKSVNDIIESNEVQYLINRTIFIIRDKYSKPVETAEKNLENVIRLTYAAVSAMENKQPSKEGELMKKLVDVFKDSKLEAKYDSEDKNTTNDAIREAVDSVKEVITRTHTLVKDFDSGGEKINRLFEIIQRKG